MMYRRIVGVVVLVGTMTACSTAPATSESSGAPAPTGAAVDVTSTVSAAPPAVETVPPLEPGVVLTPEYDPTRIAALPPPTRVRGILSSDDFAGEPLQVPREVRVGEAFPVTVLTAIGLCVHGGDPIADTEIVLVGNVATITAYDYDQASDPPGTCPAIGGVADHTATIQFMETGEGIVRYVDTGVERRVRVR